MSLRTLRVPCTDPAAAERAATFLRDQEQLDVTGTDGRHLLIPAGWSALFVWDLAEMVLAHGFGDDAELARWGDSAASARSDEDPGTIRAAAARA